MNLQRERIGDGDPKLSNIGRDGGGLARVGAILVPAQLVR